MRKLFLFISVLALSIVANAKEITITPGTANILRTTVNGCTDANNVITLSDNGEYTFDNTEQYIAISHNTTIQAADGVHPVIKPVVPIQVKGGASVKFIGVKFDGSIIGSYDYLVRFDDNNANNELEFENCEFTNLSKTAIYVKSSMNGKSLKMTGCIFHNNTNYCIYCPSNATLGSFIIDSCYFYSNTQMCLYLENTTATPLTITNSTFANNSTSGSHGVVETKSTSGAISVDHCTFYNCPATSTDHGTVQFVSPDAVVSNSIFVMPSEVEQRAIHLPNDNVVNNCLTYYYTKDEDGIRSGIDKTACINMDPFFVDAANADYTLHTASPARGAGTASSHLGASRWSKEINPSTDFSSSLVLSGVDAILDGNIAYTAENYIQSQNNKTEYGTATWKFHAAKACAVQVTVNVNPGNDKGHNYSAEIFDKTNASMGTVAQSAASWNDQDKTLIGMIVLPEAGDYSIVLSNNHEWSTTIIHGITLSYGGGDVSDVSDDLDIANAIHNGIRADGVISFADATTGWAKWNIVVEDEAFYAISINIKNRWAHTITATIYEEDGITVVGEASKGYSSVYNESGHSVDLGGVYLKAGNYVVKITNSTEGSDAKIASLTFTTAGGAVQAVPGTAANSEAWFSNNGTRADGKISFSTYADAWVKWNLSTTVAGNYNVKLYVENTTKRGHRFVVHVYEANGAEGDPLYSETWNETFDESNPLELDCGTFTFAANKKYILKVTNTENGSYAKVINVVTSYVNGGFVDLSLTDPVSLPFADVILSDDWSIADGKISYAESKATTGYAKWNVNCENYANYNVTVNISSDNGHGMKVEVFEDEAEPAIYTLDETSYSTGDLALDLGNITLSDREYVVKITNTMSSSHAKIASVVISYVNGARVTLPATLDPDDAELSELAYVESNELYFAPSDKLGHIDEQWAKWNVKVAEAGTFLFTMNVSSTNSQSYKLTIKDGESNVVAEFEKNPGSGAQEMKFYPYLTAGNYTVEVQNTYPWSNGHMVSLVVTEPASLLVLDEAAETNVVIHDNYRKGNHDIQTIRTIVAGMYNTICLPFDVETAQLKEIFGKDVVLKKMASATLEEDDQVLNLNFDEATSIHRGTPYLIKTSRNIVNPTFQNVEIKEEAGQTTTGTDADFVGNFIAGTILADPNNIFIGANNKLFFPTVDMPILGMRAYFHVHDGVSLGAIQRARIVEGGLVATEIELIEDQEPIANSQKLIINGQLIIIRDGVRYNVMGAKIQ